MSRIWLSVLFYFLAALMTYPTFLDDVFHLLTALVTYLTFLDDVFHLLPALMRHVAKDAKDYEAGKDARAAVDERYD